MLTDAEVRSLAKADKPYKRFDAGGLHIVVTPAGGKLWRLKYRLDGAEKLLSIGQYPEVSLSRARAIRDKARVDIREGRDPSEAKKARKEEAKAEAIAGITFGEVALDWYELNKPLWATRHASDVLVSLTRDVFPTFKDTPIRGISARDVLALLRKIEGRDAKETARRVRQRMSAIFLFAIASGLAENDPAAIVKGAMAPMKKGRQPAITDLDEARAMLMKAEAEPAHPATKLALRILALTAVRPGTLTGTPWSEWTGLDSEDPIWQVPAERMKLRLQHKDDEARDHLVPLSRQAVEAIVALRTISGRGPLAFPNTRHAHKPMSENAIGYLLNRAGFHHRHVPHGWRSTFSTVMNERFPADRAVIDLMLAHVPPGKTEGAYNRSVRLPRRKELAQLWADLILDGFPPASVLLEGPRR